MSLLRLPSASDDLGVLFELETHPNQSHLVVENLLSGARLVRNCIHSLAPETVVESRVKNSLILVPNKQ